MRVLMAALLSVAVNYSPVHLAAEQHLDDPFSYAGGVPAQAVALAQTDHQDDAGHAPHFASDHVYRFAPATLSSVVACCVFSAPVNAIVVEPPTRVTPFATEHENPSGLAPPAPLSSRGPPLA